LIESPQLVHKCVIDEIPFEYWYSKSKINEYKNRIRNRFGDLPSIIYSKCISDMSTDKILCIPGGWASSTRINQIYITDKKYMEVIIVFNSPQDTVSCMIIADFRVETYNYMNNDNSIKRTEYLDGSGDYKQQIDKFIINTNRQLKDDWKRNMTVSIKSMFLSNHLINVMNYLFDQDFTIKYLDTNDIALELSKPKISIFMDPESVYLNSSDEMATISDKKVIPRAQIAFDTSTGEICDKFRWTLDFSEY
jgi:hypothetical protein